MSEQTENAVQQPQQPEEITNAANTPDQPAIPEAGQDLDRITLPELVTIKSVAEAYIDHLTIGGQTKKSTTTVYSNALHLAVTYFGADRRIDSILVPHTAKFFNSAMVNYLPNGRPKAAPTVKQIKRVFRQMLEFAQTYGWIKGKLPVPNIELQHARRKQAQPDQPIEALQVEATESAEITEPEITAQN
jgi:hypothetical protein